ncbi:MAG: D-alanyl-D-alanine carboxypeptidase [Candidatus Rokubacteria bacterium]|nr:D-alanyl-D-alanine carboxypeptidase [Candidatus Rokubacteria bacterium]
MPALAQNGKGPALSAEAVFLMDPQGNVLFAKNAEEEHAPASLVKLMTLYLAYEDLEAGRVEWEEPVTVSLKAARTPRSRMGLRPGEVAPFGVLLEGVAIASANDAAVAVAEHLAGDEESFVARMNAKTQELGLTATRYANPHGLPDPAQRSTARDLAVLTDHLLHDYPAVRTILGGKTFIYRGRVYSRRVPPLLEPGGVQAFKTGFTSEAGYNLVVAAWRDGQRFLGIVLGAPTRGLSFLDAQRLIRYGLAQSGLEPPSENHRPSLPPRKRGNRS